MPIRQDQLAQRLRASREARKLTQQEVASAIGLSRSAVAQIELGHRGVSSIELQSLADLYSRELGDFLADSFAEEEPAAALFRAHPEMRNHPGWQRAVRDCLALGRELTHLESLLSIDRDVSGIAIYAHGRPASTWEAIGQGEEVAREERRRLGLGELPVASVTEVVESQGVPTAQMALPDDISGMTLFSSGAGIFVVSNGNHSLERRRFSVAHEYAHVLCDRGPASIVSRTGDRNDLREVRANAFAAAFLMPEEGVREAVRALGKGGKSRMRAEIFDGVEVVEARTRTAPGSQELQLYDVALLAFQFGTSRLATLYRLRNLGLLSEPQLDRLREQDRQQGHAVVRLLDLPRHEEHHERSEFRHRFLGLSLEAWRREEITRDKLFALAELVGLARAEMEELLDELGLAEDEGEEEPLLPGEWV